MCQSEKRQDKRREKSRATKYGTPSSEWPSSLLASRSLSRHQGGAREGKSTAYAVYQYCCSQEEGPLQKREGRQGKEKGREVPRNLEANLFSLHSTSTSWKWGETSLH